jgi:hypothetical protein
MAIAEYPSSIVDFGFDVIDGVTSILAEHINKPRAEILAIETYNSRIQALGHFANTETLATDKTLTDEDKAIQILTATVSRSVNLPAVGDDNHVFYIFNDSGAGIDLAIYSGAVLVATIAEGESQVLISDGAEWFPFGGSSIPKFDNVTKFTEAGGTANALTLSAQGFTFADGEIINFIATADNTGSMSIDVNGHGAVTLQRRGIGGTMVDMNADDIQDGAKVTAIYDLSSDIFEVIKGMAIYKSLNFMIPLGDTGISPVALLIPNDGTVVNWYILAPHGETGSCELDVAVQSYADYGTTPTYTTVSMTSSQKASGTVSASAERGGFVIVNVVSSSGIDYANLIIEAQRAYRG